MLLLLLVSPFATTVTSLLLLASYKNPAAFAVATDSALPDVIATVGFPLVPVL
jgi:hypothetical protein